MSLPDPATLPTISVVIPCRNEEKYIRECVLSVLQSNYPDHLLEVVVCDGRSTDETPRIVGALAEQNANVKYLVNERQTTPFALNLGIRHSGGDYVMILGGHAALEPGFLAHCIEVFEADETLGCVGGLLDNVYENPLSAVIAKAMSSPFGVGSAHFRTGLKEGYVDTVAFGVYKRSVFNQTGLFDEELTRNQDDEFNFRVIRAGYKIWLTNKARLKYYVRASFPKLWKQYYQYGYWKVYVNVKHRTVTSIRQLIPLFFVLFLVLGGITSLFHWYARFAWLAGLLVYGIGALVAAGRQSGSLTDIFKIVYTFVILHTGYGWGYLRGIMEILVFRRNPVKQETTMSR